MKISIFTPCHKLDYLVRAAKSLQEQTHKDYEWILLLNGEAAESKSGKLSAEQEVIDLLRKNNLEDVVSRTITREFNDYSGYIGRLKKMCCEVATGEVVAEFDHDDELESSCLEELNKCFADQTIDFAHTHCYQYRGDKTETPYNPCWGWKYRKDEETGRDITLCFEPQPASFGYIWYAPNHIRAWRKSFYDKIGGHDENLDVCDDHDILCRTYIHGKCALIDKALYRYHVNEGQNTCYGEKNAKIQDLTRSLHDKYIEDITAKWSDINNLKKLDLCCHRYKKEGWLGVDGHNYPEVDVVCNLDEAPWPFEDNSVGVIRMQDAIEHLKNPIQTMKEIYRCLAPYGWALIEVPSTDGRGAFQDPTHVSFWNSNSFWYYTREQQAQFINTPVKFQLNRILDYYPSDFHQQHNILYTKAHLMKLEDDKNIIPPGGREI